MESKSKKLSIELQNNPKFSPEINISTWDFKPELTDTNDYTTDIINPLANSRHLKLNFLLSEAFCK